MSDGKGKHNCQQLARDRAWIIIEESALIHNIRQIRAKLLATVEIMAIVKADAYGHGAQTLARTALAEGVSSLGVATITEGIQLRQAGITAPILILGAAHRPEEIDAIAHWRLQPTLCSPEQALNFSRQVTRSLTVHLNIDTGMSRLGPLWQQGEAFIEFVQSLPNLDIASIYSHLATADDPDTTVMKHQLSRYNELLQRLSCNGMSPVKFHLANSAGVLAGPEYHFDLVRVGLALYGLYPAEHFYGSVLLKPVMSVKAKITQVKLLPAHRGVSYGHSYVTKAPTLVAVVSIGYADGVPRHLSNQMSVLVRGQRAQQVGTITMDQFMIDVTDIPDVKVGDTVTLIGQDQGAEIKVEDWAELLGTISYEIVCGFNQRLPRILT